MTEGGHQAPQDRAGAEEAMRVDAWYADAVVYALDIRTFRDENGDGVGDFAGLTERLPYLSALGVTCLWLAPFFPSPLEDDGYDITDFTGIDPRVGTLGDVGAFLEEAHRLGLRVLADLVINHTSDRHPWFLAARSDPSSPYRDYYLWSETEPPDAREGVVFPGGQDRTWSYDEAARAYYHHRFYRHMPDLNTGSPAVRAELARVVRSWLERGIDGFRVDAAPFLLEHDPATGRLVTEFGDLEQAGVEEPYALLDELSAVTRSARPDAVLLAEANVPMGEILEYFGPGARRMQLLFNFLGNQYLALALARQSAAPLVHALRTIPTPPRPGRWLNYLRNHDELDLGRLSEAEREEVFRKFAPGEEMRAYGRGIRRRPASMLGGNRHRIELAYSLYVSLPGVPLIRYGDEIGMGEDLALPERLPVRTPMQWDSTPNAGFSSASSEKLIRRPITSGPFGAERVNVAAQEEDPKSLLQWVRRLVRARRACPELSSGTGEAFDTGEPAVFGLRVTGDGGGVVTLHNLADRPAMVRVDCPGSRLIPVFGDGLAEGPSGNEVRLTGYGYRWFRVERA
jgi:maltose alpha-D-glucosyltransferase / alpha-amylase